MLAEKKNREIITTEKGSEKEKCVLVIFSLRYFSRLLSSVPNVISVDPRRKKIFSIFHDQLDTDRRFKQLMDCCFEKKLYTVL